jgi:hypothetical protein
MADPFQLHFTRIGKAYPSVDFTGASLILRAFLRQTEAALRQALMTLLRSESQFSLLLSDSMVIEMTNVLRAVRKLADQEIFFSSNTHSTLCHRCILPRLLPSLRFGLDLGNSD